jgi:hypothetical protein
MTIGQAFARAGNAVVLTGLLCAPVLASAQVVSVTATPNPAVVGTPLALNVLITGVVDLFGYQFSLAFNPLVLQATGATEGAFLPTAGATIFDSGAVNNALGTVTLAFGTLTGPVPGASGSGVLARINFNVIARGNSALTFSDVILLDSNLATLPAQVNNGILTAVPEPASYALFALGLAGLAAWRQRKAG